MRAVILERDARPGHQVLDRSGHQDLVRVGQRGHARSDVHGDATDLIAHELDLSGVCPGPDLEPDAVHRIHDGTGATDRPSGTVEGRQEPISRGVDLHTAERTELPPDETVVSFQELLPCLITDGAGSVGGAHDVGEQDRGQDPVVVRQRSNTRQELLDLFDDGIRVADVR